MHQVVPRRCLAIPTLLVKKSLGREESTVPAYPLSWHKELRTLAASEREKSLNVHPPL